MILCLRLLHNNSKSKRYNLLDKKETAYRATETKIDFLPDMNDKTISAYYCNNEHKKHGLLEVGEYLGQVSRAPPRHGHRGRTGARDNAGRADKTNEDRLRRDALTRAT